MIRRIALWMRDIFIRSRSLNPTRVVAVSFAVIILVGALLLTLPIASRDGQSAGFFTGLFTATSSSCVTGLILAFYLSFSAAYTLLTPLALLVFLLLWTVPVFLLSGWVDRF